MKTQGSFIGKLCLSCSNNVLEQIWSIKWVSLQMCMCPRLVTCWLKRLVCYSECKFLRLSVNMFHSSSACMLIFFFFLSELTLCPGKFWHSGLKSRKMQKDKAHTIPLLHPSITSIQVPQPEGSSMAYKQTVSAWDKGLKTLLRETVVSMLTTLHSAGLSTSKLIW